MAATPSILKQLTMDAAARKSIGGAQRSVGLHRRRRGKFCTTIVGKRNPIADSVGYTRRWLVLRLLNGENLVSGNIVQRLKDPAWPTDLNIFDLLVATQAKVYPIVTRGRVTYCCCDFIPLLASIFACNVNLCSDSHAIAFGTYKF